MKDLLRNPIVTTILCACIAVLAYIINNKVKNVENDIDQFDIIFGEYYDLNNLSVNKIDLPDKIINFYTDNGLDISENLLPLDLDTLILLSKSNHEEFYFENLINLYDPIKYTLGFSIKPRENLCGLKTVWFIASTARLISTLTN